MRGNVIFLNGASSAGKTVLSVALQNILREPYLHISIDRFLDMLPLRYQDQQIELSVEDLDALNKCLPRIITSFHACIATLSSKGVNVIVDHVLQDPTWLSECVELLQDYPVLFVGVRCPLEELERREREREREPGTARKQIDVVHAHGIYDLEVDTSNQSPNQIAELVKEKTSHISKATAFRRLGEMLPESP